MTRCFTCEKGNFEPVSHIGWAEESWLETQTRVMMDHKRRLYHKHYTYTETRERLPTTHHTVSPTQADTLLRKTSEGSRNIDVSSLYTGDLKNLLYLHLILLRDRLFLGTPVM